ncbi:MAG: histidine kinase [Bacteroidota bacterium]
MEGVQGSEILFLIGAGSLLMVSMALALIAFYGRSQRKLLAQKLEAQDLILQETIMAQEEERNRIAKELHDDIGSKLNVVSLHIQRLKKDTPSASIETINEIIDTSIHTTRRISHELLPPTLEHFGVEVALDELMEGYEKAQVVEFDVDVSGLSQAVEDKDHTLNLFRILQELIKNSILHGQAQKIHIQWKEAAQGSTLRYKDDGKGFDKSKASKGLGMNNIESRLKMIDSHWEYHSSPGQGLKAEIVLGF